MAVLKHTSPTAVPVAPSPVPAITVPSASTSRPVNGASAHGAGGAAEGGVVVLKATAPGTRAGLQADISVARARNAARTLGEAPCKVNRGRREGNGCPA